MIAVRRPCRARLPVALLAALLSLASCSGARKDDRAAAPPAMTEAHRDSLIAASKLPGGAGVARALVVADSARARADRSIPGTP
jgi:hypothetical protein